MTSRNQLHELCMQVVYAALIRIELKQQIDIPSLMSDIYDMPFEEIDVFSKSVVIKTLSNINEMIPILSSNLESWKWERIPDISKSILLTSYAHYYYVEKVDKAIVINIAIRLAKKYLEKQDYKFINAVLEKVLI